MIAYLIGSCVGILAVIAACAVSHMDVNAALVGALIFETVTYFAMIMWRIIEDG